MKLLEITECLRREVDLSGVSIYSVENLIEDSKKKKYFNIRFAVDFEGNPDDTYSIVSIVGTRFETAEEAKKRLAKKKSEALKKKLAKADKIVQLEKELSKLKGESNAKSKV